MFGRRYNYVLTVFNHSSLRTLRLFITFNQYSTVFPLTKSEERLVNVSKQLHHIYFRQKQNDVTVRHIPLKLVCFATVVPHFERLNTFKECMSDSVTNYNCVGDTKISVSIKKPNANKCTLSDIYLTEILKSFSSF